MIIIWGGYMMNSKKYLIGSQIRDNNELVSLYFTLLITIRELILFPLIITKAYFKTKYDSLAMSEIRRLKL